MNPTGRIVGATLVGISLLWILRIAGALPFSNRSTNQAAAQIPPDRPPITEFDASRSTAINPPAAAQPFATGGNTTGSGTSSSGTSGSGTSTIADLADPPQSSTIAGTGTSAPPAPPVSANGTGGGTTPVVRAGW